MRRHTLRTYTGRYKKQRMWNRDRQTWFEAMCLAVLAIWGGVAADLHPIAEAYYSLPDKIEIVRESSGHNEGNTGGMVQTVPLADSPTDGGKVTPKSEPRPTPSGESIEEKIRLAWIGTGDEERMVKIIQCESGMNPDTIGDLGIQFEQGGKLWGRSVGLAQVRILPGRTDNPEKYEQQLRNPDFNIKEGRAIYDRQGLGAWFNCAKRVGAL